jgi:hypothetical protein
MLKASDGTPPGLPTVRSHAAPLDATSKPVGYNIICVQARLRYCGLTHVRSQCCLLCKSGTLFRTNVDRLKPSIAPEALSGALRSSQAADNLRARGRAAHTVRQPHGVIARNMRFV